MPGSKDQTRETPESILEAPWTKPRGTENEIKRMHRALLPAGYPEDLSRSSTPTTGSLGDGGREPVKNKPSPFRAKGGR